MPLKPCGRAALSQVEVPEPLHSFRLLLSSYHSFNHFPHNPSSTLSKKKEKVNRQSSPFFSMEDPIHSAIHRFILTPLIPFIYTFLWTKRGSAWIIHNQFHGEPNRWETSEWGSMRFKCRGWPSLTCFLASGHEPPWSSALFIHAIRELMNLFLD